MDLNIDSSTINNHKTLIIVNGFTYSKVSSCMLLMNFLNLFFKLFVLINCFVLLSTLRSGEVEGQTLGFSLNRGLNVTVIRESIGRFTMMTEINIVNASFYQNCGCLPNWCCHGDFKVIHILNSTILEGYYKSTCSYRSINYSNEFYTGLHLGGDVCENYTISQSNDKISTLSSSSDILIIVVVILKLIMVLFNIYKMVIISKDKIICVTDSRFFRILLCFEIIISVILVIATIISPNSSKLVRYFTIIFIVSFFWNVLKCFDCSKKTDQYFYVRNKDKECDKCFDC